MIKSLQMGRGLAALAVTAYHLSHGFRQQRYGGEHLFGDVTGRGNLGVDFFFVLSGFIILFAHRSEIGQRARLGLYAWKRFVRVYPLYWLITAIVLLAAVLTGDSNGPPQDGAHWFSVVSLVRVSHHFSTLRVAWTLYHEVFFYAMFALLLVDRRLGLAALGAWFVAILLTFDYPVYGHWSFANVVLSSVNLAFFCGMGAYWLAFRMEARGGAIAALLGLALFIATYVIETHIGRGEAMQLAFSLSFMLAIAGTVALERAGKIGAIPMLGLIGNASFSLYLTHETVEGALLKSAKNHGLLEQLPHGLLYIGIFALAVVIGILVYLCIERPLLAGLRRLGPLKVKPAPSTVAA